MNKKEFYVLSEETYKFFQQKGNSNTYSFTEIIKILKWKEFVLKKYVSEMKRRLNSSKELTVMPPHKEHIEERINEKNDEIEKLKILSESVKGMLIGNVNMNNAKEIFKKIERVIRDVEFQVNILKERRDVYYHDHKRITRKS